MDVRCERCRAQYVFDDEQVTPSGLTVQCTNCGHLFRVKKKELVVTVPVKPEDLEGVPLPATAAAHKRPGAAARSEPERSREWRVRQANGTVLTFREPSTLQRWIVERKVARGDELALPGEPWRRLGSVADLAVFFEVVEAADKVCGPPSPPVAPRGAAGAEALAPEIEVDLGPGEELAPEQVAPVKRGRGGRAAIAGVLLLAAGAAGYTLVPPLLVQPPLAPESLALPGPIAVRAPAAEPPPEAPPEPSPGVAAPEPPSDSAEPQHASADAAPPSDPPPPGGAAPAAAGAPEPRASPASIRAAPVGPRALLAQAAKLRERGEVERALDLFGRLVSQDPENVQALIGRGLCYLDLERYPPAIASFEAALGVDPREPDALLGLAETYRWQGRRADAIRYYERYLAAHPGGEEAAVARNALEELRK
jgi:predicted Zn finger-like uncharacterized protein